jgi:CelD/BcsL family acetyltransferase involved in cellulose biosynthesis
LILTVRDERGTVAGIAPLYAVESPVWGGTLRFLGDGETCSERLTILVDPHRRAQVVRTLADWLTGTAGGSWSLMDLEGVEEGDETILELAGEMSSAGSVASFRSGPPCWAIDLPASWDEFLARLSANRRNRVRQIVSRFLMTRRAVVRKVVDDESWRRGFEILVDLHQRRRTHLGEAGCFASSRFLAFQRDVGRRMLEAGLLRQSWVEMDGKPIAAECGLFGHRTVLIYNVGMEPAAEELRPGWMSFAASIKSAIEEGAQVFDFLRGDEPYKAQWRGEPRPMRRVWIAAPHPAARIRHLLRRTSADSRRWAADCYRAARRALAGKVGHS